MHYVYILLCADKTLYVGSTTDVKRRLNEHNNLKCGAHYTKIRRPVELIYSEKKRTLSSARKRESEIKNWKREEKLKLVGSSQSVNRA